MKSLKLLAACSVISLPVFFATTALATPQEDAQIAKQEAIKKALKEKFPLNNIDSITKTPYAGLYEVVDGSEVIYTDDTGSFLFVGNIIDTKTRANLTQEKVMKLSVIKFDTLPLSSAIKIIRGDGSRKIAAFEDPNCGYCKKFEQEATALNDITLYVFLYPILSPESVSKAQSIACSKDPAVAWLDYMTKNIAPTAPGDCKNDISAILDFGRKNKIMGTPNLIFEDGSRFPGAVGNAKIEEKFREIYKK